MIYCLVFVIFPIISGTPFFILLVVMCTAAAAAHFYIIQPFTISFWSFQLTADFGFSFKLMPFTYYTPHR